MLCETLNDARKSRRPPTNPAQRACVYCPDLCFGGVCHGDQEEQTYAKLCAIVRDEIAHRLTNGETLSNPAVRATLDFAAA